MKKVGILHPGQMGISVAASIKNSGFEVFWASEGRSRATLERAESQELVDLMDIKTMCRTCDAIVCVCPPHGAESVAKEVGKNGFNGLYLDANAISYQRVIKIGELLTAKGIHFIDGGIIGGPAWSPGTTWLYLSGQDAKTAAALFKAGPMETEVIGIEIGKASALKMCYAAYTKGSTALISAILAASEGLGVRENLEKQWEKDWPEFVNQAHQRTQRVTKKAWRFEGEMKEIASTFANVGLPEGFHLAAAEVYRRLSQYKDSEGLPELEAVLYSLRDGST